MRKKNKLTARQRSLLLDGVEINPLKLKPGDRITFRWTKDKRIHTKPLKVKKGYLEIDAEQEEFTTPGYVLKINKDFLMCRFPTHRKARQIRSWKWWQLSRGDIDRLQRDTIGTIKKIMKGV